jgi:hypothetical protein
LNAGKGLHGPFGRRYRFEPTGILHREKDGDGNGELYGTVVRPLVQRVANGQSCTCLVTGDTTGFQAFLGNRAGLVATACEELLASLSLAPETTGVGLHISVLEVHGSGLYDLLGADGARAVKISDHPGIGAVVPSSAAVRVRSRAEAEAALRTAVSRAHGARFEGPGRAGGGAPCHSHLLVRLVIRRCDLDHPSAELFRSLIASAPNRTITGLVRDVATPLLGGPPSAKKVEVLGAVFGSALDLWLMAPVYEAMTTHFSESPLTTPARPDEGRDHSVAFVRSQGASNAQMALLRNILESVAAGKRVGSQQWKGTPVNHLLRGALAGGAAAARDRGPSAQPDHRESCVLVTFASTSREAFLKSKADLTWGSSFTRLAARSAGKNPRAVVACTSPDRSVVLREAEHEAAASGNQHRGEQGWLPRTNAPRIDLIGFRPIPSNRTSSPRRDPGETHSSPARPPRSERGHEVKFTRYGIQDEIQDERNRLRSTVTNLIHALNQERDGL